MSCFRERMEVAEGGRSIDRRRISRSSSSARLRSNDGILGRSDDGDCEPVLRQL